MSTRREALLPGPAVSFSCPEHRAAPVVRASIKASAEPAWQIGGSSFAHFATVCGRGGRCLAVVAPHFRS